MPRPILYFAFWLALAPIAGAAQGGSVGRLQSTGDAARQAAMQTPQTQTPPMQRLEGWHIASQTDTTVVLERATPQPGLAVQPGLTAMSAGVGSNTIFIGWGGVTRVEPTRHQATRLTLRLRHPLSVVSLDSGIELWNPDRF